MPRRGKDKLFTRPENGSGTSRRKKISLCRACMCMCFCVLVHEPALAMAGYCLGGTSRKELVGDCDPSDVLDRMGGGGVDYENRWRDDQELTSGPVSSWWQGRRRIREK